MAVEPSEAIVAVSVVDDDNHAIAEKQTENKVNQVGDVGDVESHVGAKQGEGRVQHAVQHIKDVLTRHQQHAVSLAGDLDHVRKQSHLSGGMNAFNLRAYFPEADQNQIKHIEQLLVRDGKYLISEPATLKRFVNVNLNCSNWKADLKRARSKKFTWKDMAVLILLSLALLLSTPARSHLNSLASTIINTDSLLMYTPTKHGQLLYAGAVATAVGKLLTGFFIDLHDPLFTFGFFVLSSAITVILMSELHDITPNADAEHKFIVLQVLYGLNVFFQSGIFASGVKFLHDHFRPAQYGRSLTIFALGGRFGSIISSLSMGTLTSAPGVVWENGSRIAAYMCLASLVPLFLIRCFPHPVPGLAAESEEHFKSKLNQHDAPAPPQSLIRKGLPKCDVDYQRKQWRHFITALKRLVSWWQRPSFMLMACANAGMSVGIAGEGFEGLSSLFTSLALHVPSGLTSASVLIFFHIGAICSLVVGGGLIEKVTRPGQARFVLILILVAAIAQIGLIGLVAEVSAANVTEPTMDYAHSARTVYFFVGFGLGYPFFVTVPKFAMNFGGQHSALVTQGLSLFALAVCAIATSIFGVLATRSWAAVAVILLLFTLTAFISMLLFDFFEWKHKHERKVKHIQGALLHVLNAKRGIHRKSLTGGTGPIEEDLEEETYQRQGEVDGHLDKRHDATHRGLHYIWTGLTFSLAVVVIIGFFISYYWAKDPNILL